MYLFKWLPYLYAAGMKIFSSQFNFTIIRPSVIHLCLPVMLSCDIYFNWVNERSQHIEQVFNFTDVCLWLIRISYLFK